MEELRHIAQKLRAHEPQLYPEDVWDESLELRIDRLDAGAEHLPGERKPYALAVKAGLYLWNESLDKSHSLAQNILNSTGSYWHGIMHRMEGDYDNAKYWFRRVGAHPVFAGLHAEVRGFLEQELRAAPVAHARVGALLRKLAEGRTWQPDTLIDCVEQQVTSAHDERAESILRSIQRRELEALLAYSYAQSFGGNLFDAV